MASNYGWVSGSREEGMSGHSLPRLSTLIPMKMQLEKREGQRVAIGRLWKVKTSRQNGEKTKMLPDFPFSVLMQPTHQTIL